MPEPAEKLSLDTEVFLTDMYTDIGMGLYNKLYRTRYNKQIRTVHEHCCRAQ